MAQHVDFSQTVIRGDVTSYLEQRMAYTGDNLEYIGYSRTPNNDPAKANWLIIKFHYSGDLIVRQQMPDDGPKFAYVWNDRVTYFS